MQKWSSWKKTAVSFFIILHYYLVRHSIDEYLGIGFSKGFSN